MGGGGVEKSDGGVGGGEVGGVKAYAELSRVASSLGLTQRPYHIQHR